MYDYNNLENKDWYPDKKKNYINEKKSKYNKRSSYFFETLRTIDWFLFILVLIIPLINLFVLIFFLLGDVNPNLKNITKAIFIWLFIALIIVGLIIYGHYLHTII